MTILRHYKLPSLLALLLMLGACGDKAPVTGPKLNQPFPDITLQGLDGSKLALSEHQGKLIILHVWATWCPPCRKEMPGLERLAKKLDPEKFALIALSVDEDANLVREFKIKYGIDFARHIDPAMRVAGDILGVKAFPETFLIGRDGALVRHMVGEHDWDTPAMRQLLLQAYNGEQSSVGVYW